MIARKPNRQPSKDPQSSGFESTSGYNSSLTKSRAQIRSTKSSRIPKLKPVTHSVNTSERLNKSNVVNIYKKDDRQHLVARESLAQTCLSITSYVPTRSLENQQSSLEVTTWIMTNNLTRLKTAYRYLTPIIDNIISRATSYTHKEFKEILMRHHPICTISYTQYIRAYQASEIINQVVRELRDVNVKMPYKVDFGAHNVQTIKREELLENIERMADRIFIDRDLMKQLVNLHELIIETIRKLKLGLDQVSIDGLTRDTPDFPKNHISQFNAEHLEEIEIDREAVRKHIAQNFIVIGEPKHKGCHCNDGPKNQLIGFDDDSLQNSIKSSKRHKHHLVNSKGIVMDAQVDEPSLPLKKDQKSKSMKSKKSNTNPSILDSLKKSSDITMLAMKTRRCEDNSCQRTEFSIDELNDLASRSTPYTVGVKQYQLKCNEGIAKACAVLPQGVESQRIASVSVGPPHPEQQPQYFDIDEEPLIIAESNSEDIGGNRQSNKGVQIAEPGDPPTKSEMSTQDNETIGLQSGTVVSIRKTSKVSEGNCTEDCKTTLSGPCSNVTTELRKLIAKIAEQIMYLKENEYVDFQDKRFDKCEVDGVNDEWMIMQEAMFCLEELEKLKDKLAAVNFASYHSFFPDKNVGCCYREYPHVHTAIYGMPISVKISTPLLNLLQQGYPFAAATKNVTEVTETIPVEQPKTKNKACECRPFALKNIFKEKCTLTKMMKTRHEPMTKNKVVTMTVHPLMDNFFGMQANSLFVETAFTEEPDIFHLMDMADSNTSLPYVVNRSSLPNVNICPAMDITVQELRRQIKDMVIEHPKARIDRELQQIGIDNLIRASLPAKCCLPITLNHTDDDHEPFHASLGSLPLTTSDLQLIVDVAEETNYAHTANVTCNYYPTTDQFKFERYTNFQDRVVCRVYLVYYFEIFKNADSHETSEDETEGYRRPHSSSHRSRSRNHGHQNTRNRREYYTRSRGLASGSSKSHYERNTSRSLLSEFFRKFITLSSEKEFAIYEGDSKKKRRNTGVDYEGYESPPPRKSKKKYMKNQRLQTSSDELDRHFGQGSSDKLQNVRLFEVTQESEEPIVLQSERNTPLRRVASAIRQNDTKQKSKHFTPKNSFAPFSTERDEVKKFGKLFQQKPEKEDKYKNNDCGKDCSYQALYKKNEDVKPRSSHDQREQRRSSTLPRDKTRSECIFHAMQPSNEIIVAQSKNYQKPFSAFKTSNNKSRESINNLGTIYESEEKSKSDKVSKTDDTHESTFLDFLKTSELSKSFQRFVESDEAQNLFESNEIEPEDFWNQYFKLRRLNRLSTVKSTSASSIDTRLKSLSQSQLQAQPKPPSPKQFPSIKNGTKITPEPNLNRTKKNLPSKIPKPISTIDSQSDLNSYQRETSMPSHEATKEPIKEPKKLSPARSQVINKTPICYTDVIHETTNSYFNREPQGGSLVMTPSGTSQLQTNARSSVSKKSKAPSIIALGSEAGSMSSFKMLANKNGPGYIAILHPACGCPEVSIFIPCYCDENGANKRSGGVKQTPRLPTSSNSDRRIVLPPSCRIPKIKVDVEKKDKHMLGSK